MERDGIKAYARKQSEMFKRQEADLTKRFKEPLRQAAAFLEVHGLDGLIRK